MAESVHSYTLVNVLYPGTLHFQVAALETCERIMTSIANLMDNSIAAEDRNHPLHIILLQGTNL